MDSTKMKSFEKRDESLGNEKSPINDFIALPRQGLQSKWISNKSAKFLKQRKELYKTTLRKLACILLIQEKKREAVRKRRPKKNPEDIYAK